MNQTLNSQRGEGTGLKIIPLFLVFGVLLLAIGGAYVITRQRMAESRQRMDAMRNEMASIETVLVGLQAQQAAILTPESLNLRLQGMGTALVKIPSRTPVVIEGKRAGGVAMKSSEREGMR